MSLEQAFKKFIRVLRDLSRSYRVSEQLNAGNVYVNTYNDVCKFYHFPVNPKTDGSFSAPLVPFGGIGESGFGRENGTTVLEHYTHLKSVFVNTGPCSNPF